jgi:uncharacterized protein YjbK
MTAQRECELKFQIPSAADFVELRDGSRWGTPGTPKQQVNHYFDTRELLLAKQRILLRIREEGAWWLTLKVGKEVSPGNFDSLEVEHELPETDAARAFARPETLLDMELEAITELRKRVGRPPLVEIGALRNERVRREVDGWVLEIDRMCFPDSSELYELEMETEAVEAARAWVRREIEARGIRLEPLRQTKLERLLDWHSSHGRKEKQP